MICLRAAKLEAIVILLCSAMISSFFIRRPLMSSLRTARVVRGSIKCFGSSTDLGPTKDVSRNHCLAVEQNVFEGIQDYGLNRSNLLLCVSGGSDSMCMLHVVQALREQPLRDVDVAVVNFNHKMREESDEEQLFVRRIAEGYKMQFFSREFPVEMRTDVGLQENARDWRRRECLEIVTQLESDALKRGLNNEKTTSTRYVICTAHTRDDQMETLMMKLIRGVHISNFHGMKMFDGTFFKPLLGLSKPDLQKYLTYMGFDWRDDASNLTHKYKRNRVRLELMPVMYALAGGENALKDRLETMSRQSGDLRNWIESEIRERDGDLEYADTPAVPTQAHVLRIRPSSLASMPRLVLGEVLHNWLASRVDLNLSAERNDQIAALALASLSWGQVSKAVTVSNDWDVRCFRGGELHLVRRNVAPKKYKAQGKMTKMENRERIRVEKLAQQNANGTEQNA